MYIIQLMYNIYRKQKKRSSRFSYEHLTPFNHLRAHEVYLP